MKSSVALQQCLERLSQWDGRATEPLHREYQHLKQDNALVSTLLLGMAKPETEVSCTWLLKHHLEQGGLLSASEVAEVYGRLPHFEHWAARLHVYQCAEQLPVSAMCKASVARCLQCSFQSKKAIERAWAYHGLYHLARRFLEFQEEAKQRMAWAQAHEAASVKARLRHLPSLD